MAFRRIFSFVLFYFAALKAAAAELIVLTVRAGENLTLWSGLNNSIQAVLSSGNVTLLNCDHGSIVIDIKDNIMADVKNECIKILNVTMADSKDYLLQIFNSLNVIKYNIRLNVTEPLHQNLDHFQTTQVPSSPENGGYLAVYITVGLIIVVVFIVVLVLLAAYCKRKRSQKNSNGVI